MRNKLLLLSALGVICANAEEINITDFEYSGPITGLQTIAVGDTAKVKLPGLMELTLSDKAVNWQPIAIDGIAPGYAVAPAVHLLQFSAENRGYAEADLVVDGLGEWEAYCDGAPVAGKLKLHPATHKFTIKYLTSPESADSLKVTLKSSKDGALQLVGDGSRMFTLEDVLVGRRIIGVSMSPGGNYLAVMYLDYDSDGKRSYSQSLFDAKTGKKMRGIDTYATWLNKSERLYTTRKNQENGRHIVAIDAATGAEEIFASNIPDGSFSIAPNEDFLLYHLEREGKKENPKVYQVLEPEDRQPGWRDRSYPAIFRLGGNGMLQPLAYGEQNAFVSDISPDGNNVLLVTSRSRLQKRPTTVTTIVNLNLSTMQPDTLVFEDGFVGACQYSPDGKQVLVQGTPEAFGRIGCVLPDSVIPSMIQTELFIVDIADKSVRPITRDFYPNPQTVAWNHADGMIYLTAENRDKYTLYRIDPKTGKAVEMNLPENMVKGFALPEKSPYAAFYGQSDSNPDRLYLFNTKTLQPTLIESPSEARLADARLGKCEDWNFLSSRGDTIYGRFYVPDNFDPAKKYPLIVNYYGGCSPSSRNFESRYPHHVYTELGYVVYVLQPSGATGFGQEFSSRHVNTAGTMQADDIIEGTKKFVEEHPYVDGSKIGCIGASYGGFMTQYLQTVTDIFAAAISHAGISDHTSYWGEGYWGYSYSETSMAESYPWSETELYVKQSPLYNADKVHTPILFLHGDSDTNVPVGESIQMFTALKLLDRPTAFVAVQGEDHHINDFEKRRLWQDTIFAWFAKYLQDDPSWWDAMYPAK